MNASRDIANSQRDSLYAEAEGTASLGLGANILLVLAKVSGALFTGSAALMADAINSMGDVASSLAVRVALWIAQQEEDADHPYGHTKAESIAALSISIIIAFSALTLAIETIRQFSSIQASPSPYAAYVAIGCAIVKEVLYRYTMRKSKSLRSRALEAAAWDHRGDAICSSMIAVGLLVAQQVEGWGRYADPLIAIGVCCFLFAIGVQLFARSGAELMDQQADNDLTNSIRQAASAIDQVSEIEKLLVRKSGLEYFVDIHVQIDGDLTVTEGHRIGHQVKDALLRRFPLVRDVLVHIEPESH